jgi:hypothetical protein
MTFSNVMGIGAALGLYGVLFLLVSCRRGKNPTQDTPEKHNNPGKRERSHGQSDCGEARGGNNNGQKTNEQRYPCAGVGKVGRPAAPLRLFGDYQSWIVATDIY